MVPGVGRRWHVQEPFFRFWIDFQVLSSPESTTLLQRALRLVGGVCTGGPPKLPNSAVAVHKDYGYMHMGDWDVLWSITAKAMLAAEILRPGAAHPPRSSGREAGTLCGSQAQRRSTMP